MRLLLAPDAADRSGFGRTRAMTARSSEASCAGEASNPQLIIAASPIATSHPASGMIGLSAGMHPVAGRWSAPLHALISNDGSITSGSTPGRSMKGLCPSHSFVAMQKSFHDAGNEFLDGLVRKSRTFPSGLMLYALCWRITCFLSLRELQRKYTP